MIDAPDRPGEIADALVGGSSSPPPVGSSAWFLEHSTDLRCVASTNGYLLEVSASWTTQLGWSREELLARPYLDFVHPDDVEPTIAAARDLRVGHPAVAFTNRYRHKDGGYRCLRWDSVPAVEQGRIYAVVRDVTDELARTRHLEDLVELSAEGILDVDADGRIRYANAQAAELVGADRAATLVGTALGELFASPAETPDALVERLCAGGPGQPRRLQVRVQHPHDDGLWAQLAARPRFDAAGALARMTVVVTDITEHKQRERELDEARRHLEEAHLLAGVGHWHADLRTGALE